MISISFTNTALIIGEIIFVDLILSGDNALVIGAAASFIPRKWRWLALTCGGVGAILLRILFTTSATFLLQIPFLKAIGGLLVLFISTRLTVDSGPEKVRYENEQHSSTSKVENLPSLALHFSRLIRNLTHKRISIERTNFLMAIGTITIADVTMSLDNIVAIGALAKGQVPLLTIGLVFSIVLLLLGSALVSELIRRIPGLIVIASLILAWISADLIWADVYNLSFVQNYWPYQLVIYLFTFAVVIFYIFRSWFLQYHNRWIKHTDTVKYEQIDGNAASSTDQNPSIHAKLLSLLL